MKTSSYSTGKVKEKFAEFFDKSSITKKAKKTGFSVRSTKKITAYHFVTGIILSFLLKKNTYSQWAEQISKLCGKKVTKQAVFNRVTKTAAAFCEELLKDTVSKKAQGLKGNLIFKHFARVLLQDSTTLKLPDCLAVQFAGNVSKGVKKAIARIQSVLNLKAMQFVDFELTAYSSNDQGASKNIIPFCQKGDLVIRDLGYFSLGVFEAITAKGAHILSRLSFGVNIYDLNGKKIELKSLFKAKGKIDRWVLIGERKLLIRLVMVRVPKAVAAQKKRKARQDRDKRAKHSEDYYRWLEYNIYITSVSEDDWQTEDVLNAYKVRWQIEIVFKSWKTSGLNMSELLHQGCTDEHRVKSCIYLMLLFVTLFCRKLYLPVFKKMIKCTGEDEQQISLIKVFAWVCENFIEAIIMSEQKFTKMAFEKCTYEKRNKRENMMQTVMKCAS